MCVSVSIRAPRGRSIGLLSGWSVPREEHWKHYTYIHTHTCIKGNWESHQRSTAEGGAGRSRLPDV